MTLKQWLLYTANGNRRTSARRLGSGFAARHRAGSVVKNDLIRDISATGMYLLTDERWRPGTPVALTLQRAGFHEDNTDAQITLRAHAVRCGEDGVGLAFDIPQEIELPLWIHLVETASNPSEPYDLVSRFRMAKAFAFLMRICSPAGNAIRQQIHGMLSGNRLRNAIEISLQAEGLLGTELDTGNLHAPQPVVVRILHDGSWADEKPMQLCWAGLLATTCSPSQSGANNTALVEAFGQLTPAHARILNAACQRATKFVSDEGVVSAQPLAFSMEDIMQLSGHRDLLRMGRSLQHLSELGLLEERFRTSMFVPVDGINVTPTALGLELYARCNGFRGEPWEFYGAHSRDVAAMAG